MQVLPTLIRALILTSAFVTTAIGFAVPASPVAAQDEADGSATVASASDSLRARNLAREAVSSYIRRSSQRNDLELRPRVIDELDRHAEVIPGDDWIAGQRVGMRIKQRWHSAAVTAAFECEATPWWCEALAGFALHVEGSFEEAADAFQTSLGLMPRETRCQWAAELLHVLDGELRAEYEAADCERRLQLEKRVWWLADPLHIQPGNDRMTEHYTRVMGMHLHHDNIALTTARPCAESHHVPVLRGGWPEWWWSEAGPLEAGPSGYGFMPLGQAAVAPLESEPADWEVRTVDATSNAERYDPQYGEVRTLDQQIAFFSRGDSALVLAASVVGRVHPGGGMVLARSEDDTPTVISTDASGWFGLRAIVPDDAYLVSIEAIRETGDAVRSRSGHRLPARTAEGLGLSDLLLFGWLDGVAEDLDAVEPRMIGNNRIRRTQSIGLFWEVYGAPDTDELQVSLSAVPVEDDGVLQRLGQALRLVDSRDGVAVQWQDQGDESAVGKHLRLDLSQLEPGRYVLQLEVQAATGEPAISRRMVEIM